MSSIPEKLAQALQLHRSGELSRADALYRQILQSDPQHADALNFIGLSRRQQGDYAAAAELFSRAIRIHPESALLQVNLAGALRALGRNAEALAALDHAQALTPGLAEAWHQAGNLLKHTGRYAEAAARLREAVRLAPGEAAIWLNLGVALLEGGSTDEATAAFRRAIESEPRRAEAHNILGHALLTRGDLGAARSSLEEALRLKPGYAAAHDNLGRLEKTAGCTPEAVVHFRAALAADPQPGTHSNLLLALNAMPGLSPADVLAEHRRWAALHAAAFYPKEPVPVRVHPAGRRLRVGYVSPDFVNHAVAFFIEPVLAAHDRAKIEVFAYANALAEDAVTARLRPFCEHWRDIARLGDDEAAALIRADGIDILVDLAGHTGRNRLQLFARKPSPVQVAWIGYPNTTGLATMDCRLTDEISDPVGVTDAFFSEKLVRLPGPFLCYRPADESPPVGPLPLLSNGHVTFGCFNHASKLSAPVIALWSRLLAAHSTARLRLKSRGLDDATAAAGLHAKFAAHGVEPSRILIDGRSLSTEGHQRLYHEIDVALDPFPYNGTTTTCEALWMGVPVVTLAGATHVSRVGASLLTHFGAPEWVAATEDEYLRITGELLADTARLAEIRGGLRERMRRGALCDGTRFTRELEAVYAALGAGSIAS